MNKKYNIYSYEFSDNSVYVGLTYDIKRRKNQHKNDKESSVYKHIDKYKITPIFNLLFEDIDVYDAKIKEGEFVEKYKNDGWNILNKVKTGCVGTNKLYWTYEKCKEVALLCEHRTIFRMKYSGAYASSKRNDWLDDVCSHMIDGNIIWTYEKCKEIALKYDMKKDFYKNEKQAYNSCINNNWLDKLCSHMTELKNKNNFFTYEKCKEIALKYNKKTLFLQEQQYSYKIAFKNNWLDDICSHMEQNIIWDYKKCELISFECETISDFVKKAPGAYKKSKTNNWLDDFFPKISEEEKIKKNKEKIKTEIEEKIKKCQEKIKKYQEKLRTI